MSGSGWFRKQQSLADSGSSATKTKRFWRSFSVTRPKRRGAALTASGAALVIGSGVMIVAFASPGSHASLVSSEGPENATKPLQPAATLQLVSMSPAAGAKGVNGTNPIRVRFSAPLAPNSPMPRLSPSISGHWAVRGSTAVFTPAVGWSQKTKVTVKIPGGLAGVVSADGATEGDGGTLGSNVSQNFTTGSFSTMRLQQLLAQLGYLPMTWKATSGPAIGAGNAKAQLAAAYRAPAGTFTWQSGWPWTLRQAVDGGFGQHPERRRDPGVRVGARHDHGRHRGQYRLVPPVHRGGQGAEEPQRLHLRAGQPALPGYR